VDDLPAFLGGKPVRPEGPPDWPIPDEAVLQSLQAAYADGSWGKYSGAYVARLEQRLAEYHQIEHALTCGSGTFAVELALRALQVEAGHEVILAAYDYPGNFLGVHALGAVPVLVDLHPASWQMSLEGLQEAFGPKTRVIIASHLHGGLVPMREVIALAGTHSIRVIEDAAQCPGATVQGRKAGTWGDVGILSFGGSKLLTAGRGGALLTNSSAVRQRIRLLQNRANNVVCPLSELQAAALLPQVEQLDLRNTQRHKQVLHLAEILRDVDGLRSFALIPEASCPGYYKVGFQYEEAITGLPRKVFIAALRAEGIAVDEGFRALHAGRAGNRFRPVGDLIEAHRAHRGAVVLHHPILLGSNADIEAVGIAVRRVLRFAHRIAESVS
jgi:dTDP-4-amino-4,6-dideoxygalactose transaminase